MRRRSFFVSLTNYLGHHASRIASITKLRRPLAERCYRYQKNKFSQAISSLVHIIHINKVYLEFWVSQVCTSSAVHRGE